MKRIEENLFGLSKDRKKKLIDRMKNRAGEPSSSAVRPASSLTGKVSKISEEFYRIEKLPGLKQVRIQAVAAEKFGIDNPFFRCHDSIAGSQTSIAGKSYINYSSYNYLGLNGHPRVSQAAKQAIDVYGTSASASRPVSGERPIHRELEEALAEFHRTEDCIVFVSGHAANVTTIGCLFGKNDLIVHDALAHNSILQGAMLSGAKRLSFPHNDYDTLDKILENNRKKFERVIIIVEGLYSMDGDTPDMRRVLELKHRHKVFVMVDEAHSLGVMGKSGRGVQEEFDIESGQIDIIMGTLSKTLAGCGGYICGRRSLIENLKYNAPGFVYSVGMSPPIAAASLAALKILQEEPERTERLRSRSTTFIEHAKKAEMNLGHCQGFAVVPIIVGSSILSVKLSNSLFEHGINVQPIIYPAVEEKSARLRFFLSLNHSDEEIETTVVTVSREMSKLQKTPVYKL